MGMSNITHQAARARHRVWRASLVLPCRQHFSPNRATLTRHHTCIIIRPMCLEIMCVFILGTKTNNAPWRSGVFKKHILCWRHPSGWHLWVATKLYAHGKWRCLIKCVPSFIFGGGFQICRRRSYKSRLVSISCISIVVNSRPRFAVCKTKEVAKELWRMMRRSSIYFSRTTS